MTDTVNAAREWTREMACILFVWCLTIKRSHFGYGLINHMLTSVLVLIRFSFRSSHIDFFTPSDIN